MRFPTPSVDALTRPRVAVAFVSAIAVVSIGYYTYQSSHAFSETSDGGSGGGGGLHRSNAVRHRRRASLSNTDSGSSSSTTSVAAGDENANTEGGWQRVERRAQLADVETVLEGGLDDWWNDPGGYSNQRTGHNIVNLLFRVSEDNAKRNGCVHRGCQCNACGMVPIRGVRYRCANCADFDLCETCESQGVHTKTHIFYKIRVPAPPFGPKQMQPVWYTGDPDTCQRSLPRALVTRLSKDTGFERPELEAFWEQWTFMANTEWRDDPEDLCVAMDRKTFERCLVPTGGSRHAAPNLIHDRMFTFYDSNNDGLIGFTEFLQGLAYRQRKDKLRKVFEGYDMDGDGFVDRRDFLRMFRAYYVLYKQMHKDILDGLEDQLLASTEAQQLISSRQPLSSLFGREGRIPGGDRGVRLEGKTYHRNGDVDVADGYHEAVVGDKSDTASRDDILTSLFAQGTDTARRQFVTNSDNDNHWRIVRRLSGNDVSADEAHWRALLDPPTRLEQLPDIILNSRSRDSADSDDEIDERPHEEEDDNEDDEETNEVNGMIGEEDYFGGQAVTESEARAKILAYNRRQAPKLDKRRRDMARAQLHERWKRRQFYLDEEEGGMAPDDWQDDEDVLLNIREMAESAKAANGHSESIRSGSSSKVRFAEAEDDDDDDDDDEQLHRSSRSRDVHDGWDGADVPYAERDAGREVLYQVTQQAFNELLDTIFKPAEDLAVKAADTKKIRERYRDLIDKTELVPEAEPGKETKPTTETGEATSTSKTVADKTLNELLSDSGYTVESPREPRNAVDLDAAEVNGIADRHEEDEDYETTSVESEADTNPDEITLAVTTIDPTMPQFRPNSIRDLLDGGGVRILYEPSYPRPGPGLGVHHRRKPASVHEWTIPEEPEDEDPSPELLQMWKRVSVAEEQATRRGGWGRLDYDEFSAIYKSQERAGNRLDYLGSWIDFCIP